MGSYKISNYQKYIHRLCVLEHLKESFLISGDYDNALKYELKINILRDNLNLIYAKTVHLTSSGGDYEPLAYTSFKAKYYLKEVLVEFAEFIGVQKVLDWLTNFLKRIKYIK